jgi:hypothetical protein
MTETILYQNKWSISTVLNYYLFQKIKLIKMNKFNHRLNNTPLPSTCRLKFFEGEFESLNSGIFEIHVFSKALEG